MTNNEGSYIIAKFVARLKSASALSCDSISHTYDTCEGDEDIALYEEHVSSGRFAKVKQCSLDALTIIKEAFTEAPELQNTQGLSPGDVSVYRTLYPLIRASLDCLVSQINNFLGTSRKNLGNVGDASTLTFEGLFLIVKTCLEMVHPLAYSTDSSILSQLIGLVEVTSSLKYLVKATLSCISVYLCRAYVLGLSIVPSNKYELIIVQHNVLFDNMLKITLEGPGFDMDPELILFLKRVIHSMLRCLHNTVTVDLEHLSEENVILATKLLDCWYGALVRSLVELRRRANTGLDGHNKLTKLSRIIYETPQLPPAHRLRLVIQLAFTMKQIKNVEFQIESLNALTTMLDFGPEYKSTILHSNLNPVLKALLEILVNRKLCSTLETAENINCERHVALVYCLAQIVRANRLFKYDPVPEMVDAFLCQQMELLLKHEVDKEEVVMNGRDEDASSDSFTSPSFPSSQDFLDNKDTCEVITKIIQLFNDLLKLNNERLDEAITLVLCWMLKELDHNLCLKLVAPICVEFLKTKRSRMIENICGMNTCRKGTADIVSSTKLRWVLGAKMFSTFLEVTRYEYKSDLVTELLSDGFKCVLDVIIESGGSINRELEDCLGIFFKIFGIELYLKRMPLTKLHEIPITSDSFSVESYSYMLPVLKRQLRGTQLMYFPEYILPVAQYMTFLMKKTERLSQLCGMDDTRLLNAVKEYQSIIQQLNSLLIPLSTDVDDCKAALSFDDFKLLKYILALLDKGGDSTICACRSIASLSGIDDLGFKLIGVLVKKFVSIELNEDKTDMSLAISEALLSAISNCAKFCSHQMLVDNLNSFEVALRRSNKPCDSLVKISRALFPSVDDKLKIKLHKGYLDMINKGPNKCLYLALKCSLEDIEKRIKESDIQNANARADSSSGSVPCPAEMLPIPPSEAQDHLISNGFTSNSGTDLVQGLQEALSEHVSKYPFVLCTHSSLQEIANALNINIDTQQGEEEHTKQRLCAVSSFLRLLVALKTTPFWTCEVRDYVGKLSKTLIFEAISNCTAPNYNSRSSAAAIYDSLCILNLEDLGRVLRLTISGLSCGGSTSLQIGVVKCLTRLMAAHCNVAENFELGQVLKYLIGKLSENNLKLYVQLLKFIRVCIVKFSYPRLQWFAPLVLKMFENETCCSKAKIFVRRVVEKLVVRLKRDYILTLFPKEHLPLFKSVLTAKRKKRNSKLRAALLPNDTNEDDKFLDKMFKTDDTGRLLLNLEEQEESLIEEEEVTLDNNKERTTKKQRKKKSQAQPYAYIKLNKHEKNKKNNLKVLKNIIKNRK